MTADQARKLMSPDEFYAWDPGDDERYELVEGYPVKMMSGASERHDAVVINLIAVLHAQLRGSPCRPATADTAVATRMRTRRRPDVTGTCGPPRADSFEAQEPKLVCEVLSPSNKGIAWQRKLEEYRRLEGLAYILLVSIEAPQATLLKRSAAVWESVDFDSLEDVIALPEISCAIAMRDVFEGMTFEVTEER